MLAYISNEQRPEVTVNTTNLELIQIYGSRWNVKSNVSFYIQPIGSRYPSFLGTKSTLWWHYPIHHFSLLFLWKAVSSTHSYGPLSTDPEVSLILFSLWGKRCGDMVFPHSFYWPQGFNFLAFLPQMPMPSRNFLPDKIYKCAIKIKSQVLRCNLGEQQTVI